VPSVCGRAFLLGLLLTALLVALAAFHHSPGFLVGTALLPVRVLDLAESLVGCPVVALVRHGFLLWQSNNVENTMFQKKSPATCGASCS
jgi:hypothetical protein